MKKDLDELLKRWLEEKLIQREKVSLKQIEKLLHQAVRDLKTAKANLDIAEEATYLFAYLGMLRTARAVLFLYGVRPKGVAQHKTVIQVSGAILGENFVNLIGRFEKMRKKRNELTYEFGGLLSRNDALKALETAEEFVEKILKELKSRSPQWEFNF
ncbi:MAG: HEPN domain-containing protein [Candidatus Omnitrophica bacterium]|nr:HEPN domain-containing protein [Candidatus Omnitrophota bacterium]